VLAPKTKATFTEPMLLLPVRDLPEGANWAYELKLDGYRALVVKTNGKVSLRSRNNKDFNGRYPAVVKGLAHLPDETVIDGEVVALDESGRPSFNILQNHGSSGASIVYYVFDVLILEGRDVMAEPLSVRRELLRTCVLPKLGDPVRHCPELNASLVQVIESVRTAGVEGLVAKRRDSPYEPGSRSGAWRKMRLNRGQEFVIVGTRWERVPSMRSYLVITRESDLCTLGEHAAVSHRPCVRSSGDGSAAWRSWSVRSRIYPRREADAGVRASPLTR
jgi:bifunctional non-homologous end joining protein LigD